MEGFMRALPLFEKALASGTNRKERLRLLELKLSSKSAFLHWILVALMKFRWVLLYPFRRLAFL